MRGNKEMRWQRRENDFAVIPCQNLWYRDGKERKKKLNIIFNNVQMIKSLFT